MNWLPYRKGTILAGYGDFFKDHLCIIINNPFRDPEDGIEKVIVVACCTFDGKQGNDDTCLLDIGDHPFISRRSFVYYRRAKLAAVQTLREDYANGCFKILEDLQEDIMLRIEEGIRYHEQTSDEVNDFFHLLHNE